MKSTLDLHRRGCGPRYRMAATIAGAVLLIGLTAPSAQVLLPPGSQAMASVMPVKAFPPPELHDPEVAGLEREDAERVEKDGAAEKVVDWMDNVGYSNMAEAGRLGWLHGRDVGTDDWDVGGGVFFSANVAQRADKFLISPVIVPSSTTIFSFDHSYTFDAQSQTFGPYWDGGVIELSANGGGWVDIATDIIGGTWAYLGTIASSSNPLNGQGAWVADSGGFQTTGIDLGDWAGQTVRIRWRMGLDTGGAAGTWLIGNISATDIEPKPIQFFTATSVADTNVLEWLTPTDQGDFHCVKIQYTQTEPASPPTQIPPVDGYFDVTGATGTGVDSCFDGQLNERSFFRHQGLASGEDFFYYAWVYDGSSVTDPAAWSELKSVKGRTLASTASVQWGFQTGFVALAEAGIGSIYGLDNGKGVHSTGTSAKSSKTWPGNWLPLELTGVSSARPTVIPFSPSSKVVYVSADDGKVSAVDGLAGGRFGGPVWTTEDLGALRGGVAGIFDMFGGSGFDYLFFGSRNPSQRNELYAVDANNGDVQLRFLGFNDGGTDRFVGIINGMPAVDYGNVDPGKFRVYFTSNLYDSNGHSVWCLEVEQGSFTRIWSRNLGNIDGSPTLRLDQGGDPNLDRLYVSNTAGDMFAIDAIDGNLAWVKSDFDANVKGHVWADPFTADIYLATTDKVWGLVDQGGSVADKWTAVTTIGTPSVPLVFMNAGQATHIYVGGLDLQDSSISKLFEILTDDGSINKTAVIGDGTAAVGAPALDVTNNLLVVGTEDGYYGVTQPLQ